MLKRVAVLLALDQSPGMALEAVGHVAAAMGTVAFPHQTPHRVVQSLHGSAPVARKMRSL
jgi:hypothetical protein